MKNIITINDLKYLIRNEIQESKKESKKIKYINKYFSFSNEEKKILKEVFGFPFNKRLFESNDSNTNQEQNLELTSDEKNEINKLSDNSIINWIRNLPPSITRWFESLTRDSKTNKHIEEIAEKIKNIQLSRDFGIVQAVDLLHCVKEVKQLEEDLKKRMSSFRIIKFSMKVIKFVFLGFLAWYLLKFGFDLKTFFDSFHIFNTDVSILKILETMLLSFGTLDFFNDFFKLKSMGGKDLIELFISGTYTTTTPLLLKLLNQNINENAKEIIKNDTKIANEIIKLFKLELETLSDPAMTPELARTIAHGPYLERLFSLKNYLFQAYKKIYPNIDISIDQFSEDYSVDKKETFINTVREIDNKSSSFEEELGIRYYNPKENKKINEIRKLIRKEINYLLNI